MSSAAVGPGHGAPGAPEAPDDHHSKVGHGDASDNAAVPVQEGQRLGEVPCSSWRPTWVESSFIFQISESLLSCLWCIHARQELVYLDRNRSRNLTKVSLT